MKPPGRFFTLAIRSTRQEIAAEVGLAERELLAERDRVQDALAGALIGE